MRWIGLLMMFGAAAATVAYAADTKPIGELFKKPETQISGEVTNVFGNTFILQDNTGSALVETGPDWFKQRSFQVGERLTVVGEVDGSEFEAWRIVRANGTVEKIRDPKGPPPWAGGRKNHAEKKHERD